MLPYALEHHSKASLMAGLQSGLLMTFVGAKFDPENSCSVHPLCAFSVRHLYTVTCQNMFTVYILFHVPPSSNQDITLMNHQFVRPCSSVGIAEDRLAKEQFFTHYCLQCSRVFYMFSFMGIHYYLRLRKLLGFCTFFNFESEQDVPLVTPPSVNSPLSIALWWQAFSNCSHISPPVLSLYPQRQTSALGLFRQTFFSFFPLSPP